VSEIRRSHRSQGAKRPNFVIPIAFLAVAALAAGWFFLRPHLASPRAITVYYTAMDGTTEQPWNLSMRPRPAGTSDAEWEHDVALYAALQSVVGPPSDVQAVRFPSGTRVNDVTIHGSSITVDLSRAVESRSGGTFGENGEFKSLVYSMTALPGITAVQVTVDGKTLETLPGGHLELDAPLHRTDF